MVAFYAQCFAEGNDDNGKMNLYARMGILKSSLKDYSPWGLSLIERFNKTILAVAHTHLCRLGALCHHFCC